MATLWVSKHRLPDRVRRMAATMLGLFLVAITHTGTATGQTTTPWVELDVPGTRDATNPMTLSESTAWMDPGGSPARNGPHAITAGPLDHTVAARQNGPAQQWNPVQLTDGGGPLNQDPEAATIRLASLDEPPSGAARNGETVNSSLVDWGPKGPAPVTISALTDTADIRQPDGNPTAVDFEIEPIDEAMKLQMALQLLGYYPGKLDGIFGSGSFGGLHRFLREQGLPKTDRIDNSVVQAVYQELQRQFGVRDLQWLRSERLGTRLMVPADFVTHDRTTPPYVSFRPAEGSFLSMTLISMIGTLQTFEALYQTLRVHAGARQREAPYSDREFSILATRDGMNVYARVIRIERTRIRGAVLSWPRNGPERFDDVARLMIATLTEISREGFDLGNGTTFDQITDLDSSNAVVQSPIRFGSGFFLGADGHVVTSHSNVSSCDRILVDNIHEYTVRGSDIGQDMALLAPVNSATAYAVADLRTGHGMAGPQIYSAGYPFNDGLAEPTIAERSLRRLSPTDGTESIIAVDGPVARGEIGGPVTDKDGAVIGMLALPGEVAQYLPTGHAVVNSAELLVDFLARHAVSIASPSTTGQSDMHDPGAQMQSYTVPVHCYAKRS